MGACPGIEPGTSCTQSKNHTLRPSCFERSLAIKLINDALELIELRDNERKALIKTIYHPERSSSAHYITQDIAELAASWTSEQIEDLNKKLQTVQLNSEWST